MERKIPRRVLQAGLPVVLAAVLYAQPPKRAAPIERTHWKLTWVEGNRVEGASPRPAFIMLNPESHRIGGSDGCNSLLGTYELNGDHLRFPGTARTLMACATGADAGGKLVDALEKVRQWKISGDELELRDESGHDVARFAATPAQ